MLWAVVLPLAVAATDEEAAEQQRLLQEMQRLAERNVWEGVERTFQHLEAVGSVPPADGLHLAAQAACLRGDVSLCRSRLSAAVAQVPEPDHVRWLREIDEGFVSVRILGATAEDALQMQPLPLDPTARSALSYAQEQLAQAGLFDGLLAEGSYRIAGQQFVASADIGPVILDLRPVEPPGPVAAVLPKLGVGPAFLAVGAPRGDALQQPPGFSAVGSRLVGGAEGTRGALLWGAELGYLGARTGGFSALHLFTGSAMLGAHRGRLRALVGPLASVGGLRAEGVVDPDALNADCPFESDEPECDWIASVPEDERGAYRWGGLVAASGVQAAIGVHLVPIGDAAEGRVVVVGGALSDATRLYAWATIGVELAPAW